VNVPFAMDVIWFLLKSLHIDSMKKIHPSCKQQKWNTNIPKSHTKTKTTSTKIPIQTPNRQKKTQKKKKKKKKNK
jgi:hypothetical protein